MLPRAGSLSPTSPAPRASVEGLKSCIEDTGTSGLAEHPVREHWAPCSLAGALGKPPQKASYSNGNQGLAPSREEEEEDCWLLTNNKKIAGRLWIGKRIRGHGGGGGGRRSPAHTRHKWMLEGGEQGRKNPFAGEGKRAPGVTCPVGSKCGQAGHLTRP